MRGRLRDRLRETAQERDAEIFSDSVRESRRPEYAGSHCPAGRCRQFRNDRHALPARGRIVMQSGVGVNPLLTAAIRMTNS
jgi:hypothetical protein